MNTSRSIHINPAFTHDIDGHTHEVFTYKHGDLIPGESSNDQIDCENATNTDKSGMSNKKTVA